MSDGASREMTLQEWMARLPSCHLANRELATLTLRNAELSAELARAQADAVALRDAMKPFAKWCPTTLSSPHPGAPLLEELAELRDELDTERQALRVAGVVIAGFEKENNELRAAIAAKEQA